MTKSLIKPRLISKKLKQTPKPRMENRTSILPQNIQSLEQIFIRKWFYSINLSLEDFQLIPKETIDNSNIKRVFLKIHHQQAANLIYSDQNNDFMFGENINYHQIGNTTLQYAMTIEKVVAADRVLVDEDGIRLVNNAFAY